MSSKTLRLKSEKKPEESANRFKWMSEIRRWLGRHSMRSRQSESNMCFLFIKVISSFGTVPDILVNNAAGNFIMASERLSPNAYGTIIDIVLKGTLNVTTELAKRCIAQKKGAAVTSITAGYARAGGPFVLPSAVSKAGIESMTKTLAVEWGKHGMRFNAVSPGAIPTKGAFDRLSGGDAKSTAEMTIPRHACGKNGTPEEIGNLVAFMSSDHMSWMNGSVGVSDHMKV